MIIGLISSAESGLRLLTGCAPRWVVYTSPSWLSFPPQSQFILKSGKFVFQWDVFELLQALDVDKSAWQMWCVKHAPTPIPMAWQPFGTSLLCKHEIKKSTVFVRNAYDFCLKAFNEQCSIVKWTGSVLCCSLQLLVPGSLSWFCVNIGADREKTLIILSC